MSMLHAQSLAATLDSLNEAMFFGKPLGKAVRQEAAGWIAGRIGQHGSYAGMPAPTGSDYARPIHLFTGEAVSSGAATGHILGQEACRALILLRPPGKAAADALERATGRIIELIAESRDRKHGMFCCGKCSAAMWRHLAAGGLTLQEELLADGLRSLKTHRDGAGRWRRFPFHYTLLALSEIDLPAVTNELRYAAPHCERLVKRAAAGDKFAQRRRVLAERVLARC